MRRLVPFALLGLALAAGCGPDPRSRAFEVTGIITFDGRPVEEGGITLVPDDPTLPADGGPIAEGKFRLMASAGRKKVMVRASREVPHHGPANVPHDPRFEEYIPAKFNERTELEVEVVPGGKNDFEFALKSR